MSGWLAGLDAFVVGVAYLVALLTTRFVVRPLLVSVLGSAPVIGGWLTSNLDNGIGGFERAITPAANASMGTLISALDWLVVQGRGVLGGIGELADAATNGLYNLAAVSLPHAFDLAVQQAESLAQGARDYALLQVQGLEARLGGEVVRVEGEALQLAEQARQEALQEVQAAERVVLQEVRKAEQTAGSLFLQAEYDAGLLVAASEVKFGELVKLARADLAAGVAAVEHDLQQLAKAERVALEDTTAILGGDLATAEARANQAVSALEAETQKAIEDILNSTPLATLAAEIGVGEEVLRATVKLLVGEGAQEIRKVLGDAEAIRARYGPQVRAALTQLRKAG